MAEDIKAGFTGSPSDPPEGLRRAAKTATQAVRRETTALATGAAAHPQTATSLLLGIGAIAFTLGFFAGRASARDDYTYWR
ncbi:MULTISPECIES: hypothetical protein [unclassified Rhizobium]|uniref:hypothetical protein n=1 Tax=unclassified Rhizobium TaxID=2613769 RepID=UPI00160C40E8|nr:MULTISPECIES: hypothetical protein [unclassified Rhizobium]MBB3318764.1 hypothetical protein [Rhizobium sp. BK181]MBB3543097.1 hypothetical protein [Rhizobium sp. BK399]MCS3742312.1 hypothetical protein [Rhizobium sp. BK661]MCS4094860.1 hypothetical protein [Rhizobium sp. BK176]